MERKILLTSIFITLGAVAFLSGYLLIPKTNQQFLTTQVGSLIDRFNNKVEVGVPESKIPDTLLLSGRRFISFVQPFTDSKKILAITVDGDIVEINTTDLTEKILYTGQTDMAGGVFSPTGNSVVYSYYDEANNEKWIYRNLETGESIEIEGELKSAAFSPDGSQTVYLISNTDGRELVIAKNGETIKRVLKTRFSVALVTWPGSINSKNSFATKESREEPEFSLPSWPLEGFVSIISYDKNGYGDLFTLKEGGLNKVLSYQYDLNAKWSPAGKNIIFSARDNTASDIDPVSRESLSETRLFYKDIQNSKTIPILGVNTYASKCVWADEESVVCGITDKTQIKDEFYKVNITDGTKTLVAAPNTNLLTKELVLNRSGDTLFVLSDIDGKIYAIKISNY